MRPHAIGGFDVTAGEVEELAVGRMVSGGHPFDVRPHRRMALGEVLCEFVLLACRPDNEDRPGVGDRLGDRLEERVVLGDAMAGALLAVMDVAHGMVGADDGLVRLLDIEMEIRARL